MEGTQFEGKAMFKHNTLSLITAEETRLWMQRTFANRRTIYSRWVLPQASLNERIELEGAQFNTRYANRPPGNLPRLMSLDKYANNALVVATNDHVSATRDLLRGLDVATDPKFELCDPVRASRAYLRCWDPAHGPNRGAPTSEGIIASHKRVWGKHLGEIRKNKGCMVGARSGNRRAAEPGKRGGHRERGPCPYKQDMEEMEWLHPDARMALDQQIAKAVAVNAARNAATS